MDSGRTSRAAVENSAKHLGQKPRLPRVLIEEWLPAAIGGEWEDRVAGPVIGCAPLGVRPSLHLYDPFSTLASSNVRTISLYQNAGKTGLLND